MCVSMIINRIQPNITAPHFSGSTNINNKKHESMPENATFVKVPSDKLNSALKAMVIVPLAAMPMLTGCSKDVSECDYWADGNHGTSITYPSIHVLPETKIDTIEFANDTVRIPQELTRNNEINRAVASFVDKLNMPKVHKGDYPAIFAFQHPNYIQYMVLDGLASKDNKYVYDVQKVNKDGSVKTYKSEVTTDGEHLHVKNIENGKVSEFTLNALPDSLELLTNDTNGELKNAANFKVNNNRKYTMTEKTPDGEVNELKNFNLFCVEHAEKGEK